MEIRRTSHFDDLNLERQFDEIITYQRYLDSQLAETSERVNTITNEEETVVDPDIPNTPTGLVVSTAFKRHILNWDRIGSAEGYFVAWSGSFDDQTTWNEWQIIDVGKSSFFVHSNLDYNTDYRYKVASYNKNEIRSSWSEIVIAGKPGKVSLSEDIVGKLISDYLDDGIIDPSKLNPELYQEREAWNSTVIQSNNTIEELNKPNTETTFTSITQNYSEITSVAVTANDNEAFISAIAQTPSEISSTVSEVFPNGTGNASTIQQNATDINLRVTKVDDTGAVTDVPAQINISQLDGDGYIYIAGDQITLDGNTNVLGDFSVSGSLIVDGTLIYDKFDIDYVRVAHLTGNATDLSSSASKEDWNVIDFETKSDGGGTTSSEFVCWHNPIDGLIGVIEYQFYRPNAGWSDLTTLNHNINTPAPAVFGDGWNLAPTLATNNLTEFKVTNSDGTVGAFKLRFKRLTTSTGTSPPATIFNLSGLVGTGEVIFKFDEPSSDISYSGTRLVYKIGSFPTSITDGTIVDPIISGDTVTGLTSGEGYYFKFFTYSTNGDYNTAAINQRAYAVPD